MDNKKRNILIFLAISTVLITFIGTRDKVTPLESIEGTWDISEQVKALDYEQYLIEESDFDYSHPGIQGLAQEIKSASATPYDAVKITARYVYDNIQYSSKVTVQYCYDETASSALEAGKGDCVSMVRLNVALLRAMGIPARSNGGCLGASGRCAPIFAVAPPDVQAQITELIMDDFKKRGFLHEWLEVWTPETDWLILEATSGQIFPFGCAAYIQYAYDNNRFDRCVITSQNFWNLCSIS